MSFSVQEEESGEITFYMKGADMVMQSIVQYNDWLDEEVSLRSLSGQSMLVWLSASISKTNYHIFATRCRTQLVFTP